MDEIKKQGPIFTGAVLACMFIELMGMTTGKVIYDLIALGIFQILLIYTLIKGQKCNIITMCMIVALVALEVGLGIGSELIPSRIMQIVDIALWVVSFGSIVFIFVKRKKNQ
ncbi:MAG: hypothetical protein K6G65_11030 [Lachnospiraceae bacterium]|nr:hypothetical protein [Lachnospiraceae bacterium]